ncbi:hypothetical protein DL96DRAFT_842763 [Flagelloscypha sp. PMI_526]|nr:hypothetical protein DL96DRAFT_842763 [Flagelloscypha sp. PMI_526]
MARFSAPLLDPNGKARSCSLPQKKALFVFMFWMTLLHSWHLVSALGVHASPRSPGSQEVVTEPLRITNNNVTYPRLRDERTRMTQNEAQTFYDRIVALREGKFIFQPEHDFVEGNNWKEMDRLREYLALAKMETTSARPMVILSSWHW